MKAIILVTILLLDTCFAQTIPIDSLYLGQTPPDNAPIRFILATSPGYSAVERIAISKDGKRIVYHENNGYEATSTGRIKYYSYENNKWRGPFILFDSGTSPAFSVTEDTLYFEKDGLAWYSVKKNTNWLEPKIFSLKIPYWHYLQVTNNGNFYAAMKNVRSKVGRIDWSEIITTQTDTTITSLGTPLNTTKANLDFYISRDESYIIFASERTDLTSYGYFDLYISYRKSNDTWTVPQNLGKLINNPTEVRWGPFVSPDNKYLFYSRSSTKDNSDACTYWVRIENIIDSLKNSSSLIDNKKNNEPSGQ